MHRRIAYFALHRVGTQPRRIVFAVMLVTALISMWISNTATTLMMTPIAVAIVTSLGEKGQRTAEATLLGVARAGVMEVYPNHTFQPAAIVRRADLAQASSRALALMAAGNPRLAATIRSPAGRFPDVPETHLSYQAVATAVASGVMAVTADGTFQLGRPVTGAEALAAIGRLDEIGGSRPR